MISRIASYIKANHMVQPGDHVCVGVSGGADSVCLFLVLGRVCPAPLTATFPFELHSEGSLHWSILYFTY